MRVLGVRVRYMCSSCRAMYDELDMFELGDDVVCVGCFGVRYFPALEWLGFEVKKKDIRYDGVNRRTD